MTLVAIIFDRGEVAAYDGISFSCGIWPAAALASTGQTIAALDPAVAIPWLRAHGVDLAQVEVVDVGAMLRAQGHSDGPADLLYAAATLHPAPRPEIRLVHACFAMAQRKLEPVEHVVLTHTTRENARGLRVDRARAAELGTEYRDLREDARRDLQVFLPHLDDRDIRSEPAFRSALEQRFGAAVTTTAMGSTTGALGRAVDARQALMQFANAAVEMQKIADGPDCLLDFLSYYAAQTGRFSAPGFGVHSLPKHPHPRLRPLVRQREVILPSPGHWFAARDLNAIEPRVLALLSGEDALLKTFRAGDDVYVWFAKSVWPGVVVEKRGENADLRDVSKIAFVSLGYGTGLPAFHEQVMEAAPTSTEEDVVRAYDSFQAQFPKVQSAHREALGLLVRMAHGDHFTDCPLLGCSLTFDGSVLRVLLPTGRTVFYRNVRVTVDEVGDHSVWFSRVRPSRSSATIENVPRFPRRKEHRFDDGVVRRCLAPHVLVQNITQAVARDVIVHMQAELLEVKAEFAAIGLEIPFTVHDAIVAESLAVDWAWDDVQAVLADVMGRVPRTLPQAMHGLPLASEAEIGPRERYG